MVCKKEDRKKKRLKLIDLLGVRTEHGSLYNSNHFVERHGCEIIEYKQDSDKFIKKMNLEKFKDDLIICYSGTFGKTSTPKSIFQRKFWDKLRLANGNIFIKSRSPIWFGSDKYKKGLERLLKAEQLNIDISEII